VGTFRADVTIINVTDIRQSALVPQMLVDTGSQATSVPCEVLEQLGIRQEKAACRFFMANCQEIRRPVGFAIVQATPQFFTVDEVVFGEDGDLPILGARSMEGMGVRVDPEAKQLVTAGPSPAASVTI
jgi:predicted aspartyl protease